MKKVYIYNKPYITKSLVFNYFKIIKLQRNKELRKKKCKYVSTFATGLHSDHQIFKVLKSQGKLNQYVYMENILNLNINLYLT